MILSQEDVTAIDEILTNQLFIELRLLHHIISRIFLPRIRRFDFVTRKDIAIMYHIIKKIQINLPHLMIHVMQEAISRAKLVLQSLELN